MPETDQSNRRPRREFSTQTTAPDRPAETFSVAGFRRIPVVPDQWPYQSTQRGFVRLTKMDRTARPATTFPFFLCSRPCSEPWIAVDGGDGAAGDVAVRLDAQPRGPVGKRRRRVLSHRGMLGWVVSDPAVGRVGVADLGLDRPWGVDGAGPVVGGPSGPPRDRGPGVLGKRADRHRRRDRAPPAPQVAPHPDGL